MNNLALIFPGQGSQYVGMGKSLYARYACVKRLFQEADDTLGFPFSRRLCLQNNRTEGYQLEELTRTDNAQPALLLSSVMHYKIFQEENEIYPQFMAGHSLGEFSALTCAGILEFQDALKLVRKRGELMHQQAQKVSGSMLAVPNAKLNTIKQGLYAYNLSEHVVIANYNAPNQIVLSGTKEGLSKMRGFLEKENFQVKEIKVDAPFHSPHMIPAAQEFYTELKQYPFKASSIRVFSNVTATAYKDDSDYPSILSEQMIHPVKWWHTMRSLMGYGVKTFMEIGPGRVLSNILKKNTTGLHLFAHDSSEDRAAFKALYSERTGSNNDKRAFVTMCLREAICTKNQLCYADDQMILTPLGELKHLYKKIRQNDAIPSAEIYPVGLNLLMRIFDAKGVPQEEKKKRIEDIQLCFNESSRQGF